MRKACLVVLCLCLAVLTTGCQGTKTRAVEGGVIGGVLGAAAGGIIGHQSGHGAEGAAIGAAAGAVTGAIVGSQIEKPEESAELAPAELVPAEAIPAETVQSQLAEPATAANPDQMSIQEIIKLTQEGIDENVIVDKIRLTNSKFNLSADDIEYLKQQGVSEKIIEAMQAK